MDYDTFIKELALELKTSKKLPDDLRFSSNTKNNGVVSRTLTIKNGGENISPCIHLDYYYNCYLSGQGIADIAEQIIELYVSLPEHKGVDTSLSWDKVKDYIFFTVVNYKENKGRLRNMPHLTLLDLAIILKIDAKFLGISGTITIKNDMLGNFGVSNEELFAAAWVNTPKLYPLKAGNLVEVIKKEYGSVIEDDGADILNVATNTEKLFGASVILYDEFGLELKKLGLDDCYILPSSIHEVLFLDTDIYTNPEELTEMVKQVNETPFVSETEYLSSTVYRYSEIKKALEELKTPQALE